MNVDSRIHGFCKFIVPMVLLFGVLIRCFAYFRNLSFWGDEACLALNVMSKSYSELFKGLDYLQVAPPLFLVFSKALYQFINPVSVYVRDLTFRIIPFLAGLASIPCFYILLKMMIKNNFSKIVGLIIFVFNTTTIIYCAQFKQYSLELLISILLMIIFYKIIFKNKYKWYYPLFIALAPWFSLSSLFIIGSYLSVILFKNPKILLKICIPFLLSFIIFYLYTLKPVSDYNYEGMYNWWQNGYGFVSLVHPLRIAIRFGELFSFNKIIAEMIGIFMLVMTFCSAVFINNESIQKKSFLYLPIILTFIASALKLYPIEARLIMFLFPLFVISISEYNLKFRKCILTLACFISIITSIYYTINPYKFYTSAREIVHYVEMRIEKNEKILLDDAFHRYYYYIKNKSDVVIINEGCGEKYTEICNNKIELLPKGVYYFMLKNNPKLKLTDKVSVIDEYNLYSSVIKFEK